MGMTPQHFHTIPPFWQLYAHHKTLYTVSACSQDNLPCSV